VFELLLFVAVVEVELFVAFSFEVWLMEMKKEMMHRVPAGLM